MSFRLEGNVALVTGASGGIGGAICGALIEAGALLVATDMAALMNNARTSMPNADWQTLNVTSETEWSTTIDYVRQTYGRLDILVHNAGVCYVSAIRDTALSEWRRCQEINVDGIFLGLKAAQNLLAESGATRRSEEHTSELQSL